MLHPEHGRSANRNTTKLAAAAAAMILLSGCAMAMPLRPLATSSQDSRDRDFYCRADPKCSHKSVGSLIKVRSPLTVARYTMHLISF
jgi:hypothetical protein